MSHVLPNLIIAGVNKAGTTAVFRHLGQHPQVCASTVKETCYFLPPRYGKTVDAVSTYRAQFRHHAGEPVVLESTPGYFYGATPVIDEIQRTLPDTRIALILRDPVERFLSFYHFARSNQALPQNLPVDAYLQECQALAPDQFARRQMNPWFGVEGGCYASYLGPWIKGFGDRLWISFFENFRTAPLRYLQDLAAFAELDPSPFGKMEFSTENKTRAFGNPALHGAALTAYRRMSPVLNRHPRLKRLLSGTYRRINEVPVDRDASVEAVVRDKLSRFYAPFNTRLRCQLETATGIKIQSPLPAWLDAAA